MNSEYHKFDGKTDEPMTAIQMAAIRRMARQTGTWLAADWTDLDKSGASMLIWGLKQRAEELRCAN